MIVENPSLVPSGASIVEKIDMVRTRPPVLVSLRLRGQTSSILLDEEHDLVQLHGTTWLEKRRTTGPAIPAGAIVMRLERGVLKCGVEG